MRNNTAQYSTDNCKESASHSKIHKCLYNAHKISRNTVNNTTAQNISNTMSICSTPQLIPAQYKSGTQHNTAKHIAVHHNTVQWWRTAQHSTAQTTHPCWPHGEQTRDFLRKKTKRGPLKINALIFLRVFLL